MLAHLPGEVLGDIPARNANHSFVRKSWVCPGLTFIHCQSMHAADSFIFLKQNKICKKNYAMEENVHARVLLKKVVLPQNLLLVLPQLETHLGEIRQ